MARFADLTNRVNNIWQNTCNHEVVNDYQTATDFEKIAKNVLYKMFDGQLQPGEIDAELYELNTSQLNKAVTEGWDSRLGFNKTILRRLEMHQNVHVYAALKNHSNILEMAANLFDSKNRERTLSEFIAATKPIYNQYNKNWLKAEFNYARSASRAAAKWQRLANKGGTLIYKTIGDGAVRDSHRLLDGTKLPATHSFWQSYYPPNGWGCRCFVRHSSSTDTVEPQGIPDDIPEMMRNNVGITGQIFNKNHPIRQDLDETQLSDIINFAKIKGSKYIRNVSQAGLKKHVDGKTYSFTDALDKEQKFFISNNRISKGLSGNSLEVYDKIDILLNLGDYLKSANYIIAKEVYDDGTKKSETKKKYIKQYHYLEVQKGNEVFLIDLEELKKQGNEIAKFKFKTIKKIR